MVELGLTGIFLRCKIKKKIPNFLKRSRFGIVRVGALAVTHTKALLTQQAQGSNGM